MPARRKAKCPVCRTAFTPKRSTAKYDKPACREKARRQRATAVKKAAPAKETSAPKRTESGPGTKVADNHELVVALRQELETARALNTFEGQLALELARRLVTPGENASALADKVRAAKAAALGSVPAGGTPEPEPEDDEVTRARKAREEARQAAGLA